MTANSQFRYYFRVKYGECDPQKVVFNARYSDYVDAAFTEFVRALGFGQSFVNGNIDFQLIKLTLEWRSPAHFDQVLEASVYAKHLGNTSFTLTTEFRVAGTKEQLAIAETVYVFVNPSSLQKVPLPSDFRLALERGAPGLATDHAEYSKTHNPDHTFLS
jgi:acyl-CoA thioester hydrolase